MNELSLLLAPPGEGIYTVSTGSTYKAQVQKKLYGATPAKEGWLNDLSNLSNASLPLVLGIPSDAGGGILRGANFGPIAIREALYETVELSTLMDIGDIRVIPHLLHDAYLNQETIHACQQALYGQSNQLPVSPLSIAERVLSQLFASGHRILSFGGDHSCSYPCVAGLLASNPKAGVLHFDAHTDLMPSRLGIDLCFGTWTHHVLPSFEQTEQLVQVGIRTSLESRSSWENKHRIKQIWSDEVLTAGAEAIAEQIIEYYHNLSIQQLYITVDIDALDVAFAAATGTPEQGGLSPEQVCTIIEKVGAEFSVVGADIMEVAPFTCSTAEFRGREPDRTLESSAMIGRHLLEALKRPR